MIMQGTAWAGVVVGSGNSNSKLLNEEEWPSVDAVKDVAAFPALSSARVGPYFPPVLSSMHELCSPRHLGWSVCMPFFSFVFSLQAPNNNGSVGDDSGGLPRTASW